MIAPGPLIAIYTEDRTGGGLQDFLVAEANAERIAAGKLPLRTPSRHTNATSNARLLEQCEKYENLRFNSSPRFGHIFFVIDAKNAEFLAGMGGQSPVHGPSLSAEFHRFCNQLRDIMTSRARGRREDKAWSGMADGFHPHVLVWERESLMIPVADALSLGTPDANPYERKSASKWMGDRHRELHRTKYEKSFHGPQYLGTISASPELRRRVLATNPSVVTIVNDLVNL